jgi:hypothetical protein
MRVLIADHDVPFPQMVKSYLGNLRETINMVNRADVEMEPKNVAPYRVHAVVSSESGNDNIVKMAQARLRACGYVDMQSLACEFHEGALTIRGRLDSYYLKQLAQESVRRIRSVEVIVNVVEVVPLDT